MKKKSYLLITFFLPLLSPMSLFVNAQKFPPNFELVKKSYSDRFFLSVEGEVKRVFFSRIANSNFIHSTALMQFFLPLITREILLRVFCVCRLQTMRHFEKFETLVCNSQNEDCSPPLFSSFFYFFYLN